MNDQGRKPITSPRPPAEVEREREELMSSVDGNTISGSWLFVAAIVAVIALAAIPVAL